MKGLFAVALVLCSWAVQATEEKGKETYDHFCIICHQDGLAGAPKFRNSEEWAPRIEGKKIEELVVIVTNGLNSMPPQGTCSECSEEDLRAAIEYMLPRP
jgi:cytochrome c5